MPRIKKEVEVTKVDVEVVGKVEVSAPDLSAELYACAKEERDGLTLLPSDKVAANHTVEAVEPRIEKNGLVVCRRIAK